MMRNKKGSGEYNVKIPQHVAIIMDGNGRWAKKRLMSRSLGHKKGMERMIKLIDHAFDIGIGYMTVYALSIENLSRPQDELDGIFSLIRNYFSEYIDRICARGGRFQAIGDLSLLPLDVLEILRLAETKTKNNKGGVLNMAIAYGGRQEIVNAATRIMKEGGEMTENNISAHLYTAGQPDPDLIIRTGKEKRISNFLLFQSAYAEFYFSDKMFPDFSNADLDNAIKDYSERKRRYGKTDEQCEEEMINYTKGDQE